ncbi:hypothetical protein LCGC14_0943630 [marine sediment metagenome]|uniref:Uncharacterized protein n=2 Tax=root TaxID=1 RepID=A0A831QMS8_9FLAO|nr:hypothetical protein [Pricia antarctica]
MKRLIILLAIIFLPAIASAQSGFGYEYQYEVFWTLEEEVVGDCPPQEDEFGRTRQSFNSLACTQIITSDKRRTYPRKKDAIAFMIRAKVAGMKDIKLDSMPSKVIRTEK